MSAPARRRPPKRHCPLCGGDVYAWRAMDEWVALFANRDEMAWEYARWIANEFTNDWRQINEAIIRRWSVSGLLYIKRRAWSYVQGDDVGELCAAGPREFVRAGSGE